MKSTIFDAIELILSEAGANLSKTIGTSGRTTPTELLTTHDERDMVISYCHVLFTEREYLKLPSG